MFPLRITKLMIIHGMEIKVENEGLFPGKSLPSEKKDFFSIL